MKRDPDLIRHILLHVEASSAFDDSIELAIEGYSPEQVSYHVCLLNEARFIVADDESGYGDEWPTWKPMRLTWHGHEFLDAARDEGRWKTVKQVMTQTKGLTISVTEQLLMEILKNQALKLLS